MIVEQGLVVEKSEQFIWVETVRKSSCQSCAARGGCGQSVLSQLMDESKQFQKNIIKVEAADNSLVTGDNVSIAIDERALIRMSALVYGLPVLFLFLFSGLSQWLGFSEGVTVVFGASGLALALWVTRRVMKSWSCDTKYKPALFDGS